MGQTISRRWARLRATISAFCARPHETRAEVDAAARPSAPGSAATGTAVVAAPSPTSSATLRRLRQLGMDHKHNYNIMVVGNTGTGKSTLINSLRGLGPRDEGAAQVQSGAPCTALATPYPCPTIPHLVLWDVPGGGADDVPQKTYCEDQCLDQADALLLCFNRWTELCSIIMRNRNPRVPIFLVYTNLRKDLKNDLSTQMNGFPVDRFDERFSKEELEKELLVFEQKLRDRVNESVQTALVKISTETSVEVGSVKCFFVESPLILWDGPYNCQYDAGNLMDEILRSMHVRNPHRHTRSAEDVIAQVRASSTARPQALTAATPSLALTWSATSTPPAAVDQPHSLALTWSATNTPPAAADQPHSPDHKAGKKEK